MKSNIPLQILINTYPIHTIQKTRVPPACFLHTSNKKISLNHSPDSYQDSDPPRRVPRLPAGRQVPKNPFQSLSALAAHPSIPQKNPSHIRSTRSTRVPFKHTHQKNQFKSRPNLRSAAADSAFPKKNPSLIRSTRSTRVPFKHTHQKNQRPASGHLLHTHQKNQFKSS